MNSSEPAKDLAREILDRRVMEVCEAIGGFIEYWGFKSIHGRVWTILALSQEPLAQVQIAQKLGVSRSLVSGVISELVDRGLVRATDQGRNAPYVAMTEFWPTVAAVLRKREWMLLERSRQALEGLVFEADRLGSEAHSAGYDLKRAKALLGVTEAAQNLLRLVIGFPTASNSERIGGWLKSVTGLIRRLRQN